ncbi:facilitated trehalose transporter Tret1-like isoform X2 [Daktulosphaira vitifoliae]|uniref:facilitated trehalose transporter Tret1-like isoform X2 n=1 Tax=Daktulosphaira vitifoliae TaxID=58002 RepID=UPI0021AA078C|nr:facilitated trehalose transporter Tret1-like isoform X2 [Daktulosphaira vitifoliae]
MFADTRNQTNESNDSDNYKEEKTFKSALSQILAISAKNVLLLTYGMTIGLPTIAIPALYSDKSLNSISGKFSDTLQLSREQISWFSSINLICVPLGCLMSGTLTQPFGRKRSMVMLNLPFIVAWLLFHNASTVLELYLAVALCGMCGGLLEAPVFTYAAEITQPHIRGVLSASSAITVIFGVMSQYTLGNFFNWRKVALLDTFIPIGALISLLFVPESPYWLISKGRITDAEKSLCWLRGWVKPDKVQFELSTIQKSVASSMQQSRMKKNKTFYSSYLKRTFLLPYFIITAAFFFGHFGGMTTLQINAVNIFESLGSPISGYASIFILGISQLIGVLLCIILIHWTGKRPLVIVSTLGTSLCFFIVSGYAYTRQYNIEATNNTTTWIPIVFLNMAVFLSYISIRSLPWLLIGEVYPPNIRGPASGTSCSSAYIFAFAANKSYFVVLDHIQLFGTFLMYAIVNIVGCLVLYKILPETEGRSLQEIQNHFADKSKTFVTKVTRNKNKEISENWAAENTAYEIDPTKSHL